MEEKSTKIAGIKVEEWYENALSMKEKGIDLPLNFTVSGASMNPIIRKGLDVVTVLPKDRIKLYDVVLFKDKRNTADYVLHRVVKIDGDVYTTCGDGGLTNDAPITEDKILGVATKIKRGKKVIDCEGSLFKTYTKLWVKLFKIRKPLLYLYRGIFGV